MAKVKLIVGFARTAGNWNPGDVVDLPGDEAEAMISAGYAELTSGDSMVEIPEKKVKRTYTKRGEK